MCSNSQDGLLLVVNTTSAFSEEYWLTPRNYESCEGGLPETRAQYTVPEYNKADY